ncbi:hypothetical protein [Candidatus Hepatobacter penaei]|uniref:hypothetical protein n=1 Tax=Candidatus Hepatobacter penaei TaxID=1274402 RepID=UPI0004F3A528|nr:hypothetical protein [Candidatus Hepatobacter penaei]
MRFFSLLSALLLTHSALHAGFQVTTQDGSDADIMLHNGDGSPPRIVYATRLNKGTGTLEKLLFDGEQPFSRKWCADGQDQG